MGGDNKEARWGRGGRNNALWKLYNSLNITLN